MKIYQLILVISVMMTSLFPQAQALAEARVLTAEEKETVVDDFRKIESNNRYVRELEATQDGSEKKVSRPGIMKPERKVDRPHKENMFFGNGKYKIRVSYALDVDFPKKYGGSTRGFSENHTDVFAQQWSQIIFEHYLGKGYAKYQPELYSVATVCTIVVLVRTSKELEELLGDPRIVKASHVGTPALTLEETY